MKMYRIGLMKRKDRKNDKLALFNKDGYVASVAIENEANVDDLKKLKSKMDLDIDWERIWYRFVNGIYEKRCEECACFFETRIRNQKYCSDACRRRVKSKVNAEYYEDNRLVLLRKSTERRRQIQHRHYTTIHEHIINIGSIPKGFNQIDENPNNLGESNLRQHPKDNFDVELDRIEKEMKRFKLLK